MRFAKHFAKQEGRFALFAVLQRATKRTVVCRKDRGPQRGQMVIEGKRAVEESEGIRAEEGTEGC
jgi:hypothetical protein